MKLDIFYKNKTGKNTRTWRLENVTLPMSQQRNQRKKFKSTLRQMKM